MDASESVVYPYASATDPSLSVIDVSGSIIPTSPESIRLEDILGSQQLLVQQESADKMALESIAAIPYDILKPRLIQWAAGGFRNAHPIYEIPMRTPPLCSDGVSRSLQEYIEFVSGKSISDHVSGLQVRVPDFGVSFAYSGSSILIVVSKSA